MSDDLVKRLRYEADGAEFSNRYADLVGEAADRIEELEAKYPTNWVTAQEYYKKRSEKAEAENAELKTKLEKAVETLAYYAAIKGSENWHAIYALSIIKSKTKKRTR